MLYALAALAASVNCLIFFPPTRYSGLFSVRVPVIATLLSLAALAWTAPLVCAALVVAALLLAVYTYPRRDQVCARYGDCSVLMRNTPPLEGVFNFREAGGIPTADGTRRIRPGVLYRSGAMHRMTDADLSYVDTNIGISLIIDLRGPHEREFEPDRVSSVRPPRMLALDVSDGVFAKLPGGMQVDGMRMHLTYGTFAYDGAVLAQGMRDFLWALPEHGGANWGVIIDAIIEANGAPVVIHCAAGKDRTGVAMAFILLACGVGVKEVLDDYELSNVHNAFRCAQAKYVANILSRGWTKPEQIEAVLGDVVRENMRGLLERLEQKYGSVLEFLRVHANVTPEKVERLRELLLV